MHSKKMIICQNCGEEIKENSKACYYCGSDDFTGWSDSIYLDGIDLPDADEYEDLRKQEFGKNNLNKINWITITGILLIIVFLAFVLNNLH